MMQGKELMEYISGIIKSVCRFTSLKIEGAILNSTLTFIIDDSLLYCIDLSGKIDGNTIIGFESSPIISQDENGALVFDNNLVESANIYQKVFSKCHNILSDCNGNNKVFEDPFMLNDEEFKTKVELKADDGCEFFKAKTLNNIISIPVFSGFPLLSKGDKIGLTIYNSYISNQYIVVYNISKKKLGCNYSIYYRILNLNKLQK